jgi:hypothetical protein
MQTTHRPRRPGEPLRDEDVGIEPVVIVLDEDMIDVEVDQGTISLLEQQL